MRLAWFRPAHAVPPPGDDLATVIAALSERHAIDVVDQARAHDFVWLQARRPYDLCVFELGDTAAHAYIWPYLLHYPGVLALRATSLHASRTTTLMHRRGRQDYDAEMRFSEGAPRTTIAWHVTQGTWPMLRVPVLASRLVAVADADWAETLRQAYPTARVRYVPVGVATPTPSGTDASHTAHVAGGSNIASQGVAGQGGVKRSGTGSTLRVAVLDGHAVDVVDRAIARAWTEAAPIERDVVTDARALPRDAQVVVAIGRPALGATLVAALAGLAAGIPMIVAETGDTAAWPALDPHTWQPRGYSDAAPPAVISLDPRDEEHSLMLALRRLASDVALRQQLGRDGRAWWAAHHTPQHATCAWEALIREAVTLAPPPAPEDWPAHLTADGTELARRIASECGLEFDAL